MSMSTSAWLPLLAALVLLLPVALLATTLITVRGTRPGKPAWRCTESIAASGLIVAALLGLHSAIYGTMTVTWAGWAVPAITLSAVGASLLALTALLLWVLTRYARRYLDGSPRQGQYLRWQNLTLVAVWGVLLLDSLLGIAVAWLVVSLTVQPLITLFGERAGARAAARRKFRWDRLADAFVLAGVGAIWYAFGTTSLEQISAIGLAASQHPALAAAGLTGLALAAVIRAAQVPAQGWLLQVMEAPTPVSALLHAGVINLGGIILLRMSSLLEAASMANLTLVVAGGLSIVVGASAMMHQNRVKTRLAWSSVAQLGLMLLALGLGAYPLVLLHLLAHSLYKAHAFLGAGTLPQAAQPPTLPSRQLSEQGLIIGSAMLTAMLTALLSGLNPAREPTLWIFGGLLLASTADLVLRWPGTLAAATLQASLAAAGLTLLYSLWQHGLGHLVVNSSTTPGTLHLWLAGCALLCLVGQQYRFQQKLPAPSLIVRPAL